MKTTKHKKFNFEEYSNEKVCKGLSEICLMLSKYCEKSNPKQAEELLKKAGAFYKLSKIINPSILNIKKEVKMKEQFTEHQIKTRKEDKIVKKIIEKIISLEKKYPQYLVEKACYRYKSASMKRKSAEREIKQLEKKLGEAKSSLSKGSC